jgi:hypothetical protein
LAWLTLADQAGRGDAVDLVEHLVEDTGYPRTVSMSPQWRPRIC